MHLGLKQEKHFICQACGTSIIIDGIMMGCHQDFLPFLQEEDADVTLTQIIKGCTQQICPQ